MPYIIRAIDPDTEQTMYAEVDFSSALAVPPSVWYPDKSKATRFITRERPSVLIRQFNHVHRRGGDWFVSLEVEEIDQ